MQLNIGAKVVVKTCMNLQKNEELLIITDEEKLEISKALAQAAIESGANVTQIILSEEIRPILKLNEVITSALKSSDVVLTPFKSVPQETRFRLDLIKIATTNRARLGHMPGIDKDMLISGALTADYNEVSQISEELLQKMMDKNELHVTSPGGTDLTMKLGGRKWNDDSGLYHKQGEWGNLPAGEIYIAPLENGVDGKLVVDGSIGFFGMPKYPIEINIVRGKIKERFSLDEGIKEKIEQFIYKYGDNNAQIVGEFGIGTNKCARITGNLLEDEKVYGTAHLAFGDNIDMGGINKSNIHIDMIFKNPIFK